MSTEIKDGEEGVGTAAVVEDSWRVEGCCRVPSWELECPDREDLSDQEGLASKMCQVASICCITSTGAMTTISLVTRGRGSVPASFLVSCFC